MEQTGQIRHIGETQTFPSGFQKRELVIEWTNERGFENMAKFDVIKDKCELLDQYEIGEEINVHFDLRGREYNGRYYTDLQAWKVDRIGNAQEGTQEAAQGVSEPEPVSTPAQPEIDEEIPF